MHDGFEFNALDLRLRMTLDALSNKTGGVIVQDAHISTAAEEFKDSLVRQLQPEERSFKLRASNIGRPLCILQMDAANPSLQSEQSDTEYNHILRMLLGDATEAVVTLFLKASGANITGQKDVVEYQVGETLIRGENDISIDGKVYDIKSCSPYAFDNKWAGGWDSLYNHDDFGYVEQLFIYAEGDPKRMGGWIVVNKSSGEIKVVDAKPTTEQLEAIATKIARTEITIRENRPFQKLFAPEEETHYRKKTGNMVLPMTCVFCNHKQTCWPEAVYRPNPNSSSKTPALKWYAGEPTQMDKNAD